MLDKKISQEIIDELKSLYKKWPEIRRFLANMGCRNQDAEDIFQEALIIYTRKKKEIDFELNVEPFYYVKNTCKLLWFNELRKQKKLPNAELSNDLIEIESNWFQIELKLKSIEKAMENLGKQCQEILQLFYGLGFNMVDIAKKIGLRNENVVRVQKFRCIQKAKELAKANHALEETEYSSIN